MTESADRYRKVADTFTQRVSEVPEDAWDNPAPCEGWVARDVVAHLVDWLPAFFCGVWGLDAPVGPAVADDPAGAWAAVDALFTAALADPAIADAERDTPMGRLSFADATSMICTNDVLIHTWDLARATGLDETLDPVEVQRYLEGVDDATEEMMRQSGHYGPKVAVPDGADEQTRLIGFLGRQP